MSGYSKQKVSHFINPPPYQAKYKEIKMRILLMVFIGLIMLACSKKTPSPTQPVPVTYDLNGTWVTGPIDSANSIAYKLEWTFHPDRYSIIKYRIDSLTGQTTMTDSGTYRYLPGLNFPSFIFYSDSTDHYGFHYTISGDSLFLRGVDSDYDSLIRITGTGSIIGRWFLSYACGHGCDSLFMEYTQDSLLFQGAINGPLESSPIHYLADGLYESGRSNSTRVLTCYSLLDSRLYLFQASNHVLGFKRL